MDRLRKERTPLRKAVTLAIKEIDAEVANVPPNVEELDDHSTQLLDLYERLSAVDVKILEQMTDDGVADDVYETEWNGMHEYSKKIIKAKNKINRILARVTVPPPPPTPPPVVPVIDVDDCSVDKKKSFRLPKLELKKFNGQLMEWISFWSQFKKINEDEELHATDKFQYLLQAMEPNSRPMEVVSSYPPSEDNYPKALTALKERFGRDDLLVEVYVRELLKLVIQNMSASLGKPKVSSFFDRIESHLRALETLGVTDDKFASMLFPMVESSLPEETLRAWQRSTLSTPPVVVPDVPPKSRLSCLMDFLQREVESEERIKLARTGFGFSSEKKRLPKQFESEVPTAASLHVGSSASKCIFCDKSHDSKECSRAQDMTLEERRKKVETRRCCFSCLKPGHTSKNCRSFAKCPLCSRRHGILMSDELDKQRQSQLASSTVALNSEASEFSPTLNTSMSASTCSGEVILQTLMVKLTGDSGAKVVRALVDSGSQRSYLLESTAAQLSLLSSKSEDVVHLLFGGHTTTRTTHRKLQVQLSRVDGANPSLLELLCHKVICGEIPRLSRNQVLFKQLKAKGVILSDVGDGAPKIELLLGADACGQILTGRGHQLEGRQVALETIFGWTIMGSVMDKNILSVEPNYASHVVSMTVTDLDCESLWKLEAIGITDLATAVTREEHNAAERIEFEKPLSRENSCYVVKLPRMELFHHLPTNFEIAAKRYQPIVKKLPVFKPKCLSKPVRPVFDASCRSGGGFGFRSDVRMTFQMIIGEEADQDVLRFLWFRKDSRTELIVYRNCRVPFGLSSSPFFLGATLEHRLKSVPERDWRVADKLLSSTYVDYCVSSVDSMEEYWNCKERATSIVPGAQMDLRLWAETIGEAPRVGPAHSGCGLGVSNGHPLDVAVPPSNVRGLSWNRVADNLSLKVPVQQGRHVPGANISAELLSRGCFPSQLLALHWWEGPSWLRSSRVEWPAGEEQPEEETVQQEAKKCKTRCVMPTVEEKNQWYEFKFSNYHCCVRVMAWVKRLINKCRRVKAPTALTLEDLECVEMSTFKCSRKRNFHGDLGKSTIKGFQVVYGEDGLARLKTKLLNKDDTASFGLPVALPNNDVIVERMTRWEHQEFGHAGVQTITCKMQEQVWIVGGRGTEKKILGDKKLTFFQLESATVNDRPLTYVSEDTSDLSPLTPSLFLKDLPVAEFAEAAVVTGDVLRGAVRNLQQLRDELRSRFRREYLALLVHRGKTGKPRGWKVGDIVLITADNVKHLFWSMERIVELMPGRDGFVRVAKVRTASGELLRPVQRLYPLEVSDSEEVKPITEVKNGDITQESRDPIVLRRSSRKVKVPERLMDN